MALETVTVGRSIPPFASSQPGGKDLSRSKGVTTAANRAFFFGGVSVIVCLVKPEWYLGAQSYEVPDHA
jgi:hypothetical protein